MPDSFAYRRAHYDYEICKRLHSEGATLKSKILHLGCNLGVNSILLAEMGYDVVGVDIQQAAIDKANNIWSTWKGKVKGNVEFFCQDFTKLSLPYKFNSLVSFDTFEHVWEEDLVAIHNNIVAHLNSGSQMYIHVPLERSFFDPAHVCLYNENKAKRLWGSKFFMSKIWTTQDGTRDNIGRITSVTGHRINMLMEVK